jgi:hypothetical protein
MLPSTPAYREMLRGPHRRVAYLQAEDIFGNVRERDVPLSTGSVTANLVNRVTRSAAFTLPGEWFPSLPDDPLSPYSAVVRIRAGIAYGDNSEETFPVFTGRVYDARLDAAGTATFRADDLAADVVAHRFEQPQVSTRSSFATHWSEIQKLIRETLPNAVFGPLAVLDSRVPSLVWDEDRGQALDDLAEALGGRWFATGDGTFVLRPFDYTLGPVVSEILDGPRGLMSQADITVTRDGSANSVVVVAERLDGTNPVRVVQRDTATASPTRFGGPFGRVVQVIKLQTPLTQPQARILARTQLAASVALTEQWSSTVVADHSLEPGDTVRQRYRGRMADQIIDGITYPLGPQAMRLDTRGTVQLSETGA